MMMIIIIIIISYYFGATTALWPITDTAEEYKFIILSNNPQKRIGRKGRVRTSYIRQKTSLLILL
jgi:hypothetical protein